MKHDRRLENISGSFFVDTSCINCGTCRWVAPKSFKEVRDQSAVYNQPSINNETIEALQALVSCPTGSIHSVEGQNNLKEVINQFPLLIAENVYHCGFHSEKSYGATSYFIRRPQGNILVDSPRFVNSLVKRMEEWGGIKYLYLTHRDDVADHQKFKSHFGCKEIIHEDDYQSQFGQIEMVLSGLEPFKLDEGVTIIPVPGHTKGHTVLLYNNKFLFTGDHLAWSSDLGHLSAFEDACWYSWSEQISSMERLLSYSFEWILPGHGARFNGSPAVMKEQIKTCLQWMKGVRN